MQVLILVMVDLQKHTASLCLNHKLVMLLAGGQSLALLWASQTRDRPASCIPCLHHMDVYHMHVTVAAESNAQVDHSMAES